MISDTPLPVSAFRTDKNAISKHRFADAPQGSLKWPCHLFS